MFNNLKLFFAISLIFSLFIGCGSKTEQQQQTGQDNKTTTQGDQVQPLNQTPPAGEQKTTEGKNELGIKDGMPGDYPSDVPQPSNSKALGYLNTQEGTVVTFESTDRPKDIFKGFGEQLEKGGFKKGEGEMMSDDGGMAMWTKDKREVSIMLAWQKEKSNTSAVVTYK